MRAVAKRATLTKGTPGPKLHRSSWFEVWEVARRRLVSENADRNGDAPEDPLPEDVGDDAGNASILDLLQELLVFIHLLLLIHLLATLLGWHDLPPTLLPPPERASPSFSSTGVIGAAVAECKRIGRATAVTEKPHAHASEAATSRRDERGIFSESSVEGQCGASRASSIFLPTSSLPLVITPLTPTAHWRSPSQYHHKELP